LGRVNVYVVFFDGQPQVFSSVDAIFIRYSEEQIGMPRHIIKNKLRTKDSVRTLTTTIYKTNLIRKRQWR
jgi:hypothetical protein